MEETLIEEDDKICHPCALLRAESSWEDDEVEAHKSRAVHQECVKFVMHWLFKKNRSQTLGGYGLLRPLKGENPSRLYCLCCRKSFVTWAHAQVHLREGEHKVRATALDRWACRLAPTPHWLDPELNKSASDSSWGSWADPENTEASVMARRNGESFGPGPEAPTRSIRDRSSTPPPTSRPPRPQPKYEIDTKRIRGGNDSSLPAHRTKPSEVAETTNSNSFWSTPKATSSKASVATRSKTIAAVSKPDYHVVETLLRPTPTPAHSKALVPDDSAMAEFTKTISFETAAEPDVVMTDVTPPKKQIHQSPPSRTKRRGS